MSEVLHGLLTMSHVAAIVLAAGQGRRFDAGGGSKLAAAFEGVALVRRVVSTALSSQATPVVVVTGHAREPVARTLDGLQVEIVHNPAYAEGMASSLVAGVTALSSSVRGALILLADMPLVRAATVDRLIAAFLVAPPETEAVVPTYEGRQGNPVLLGRSLFSEVLSLEGDQGARRLLTAPGRRIMSCAVDDPGIEIDVDTRDALASLAARKP